MHHFVVPDEALLPHAFAVDFLEPSFRRRARHDASGAVHRRKKRFARERRINAFNNDRVIAHAPTDEAALAGKRRSRALANNPETFALMFLLPREVAVIVHFFDCAGAENSTHDMAGDRFAASVSVAAGERHRGDVILPEFRRIRQHRWRHIHAILAAGRPGKMRGRPMAEPSRSKMHPDPDSLLLIGKNVDVVIAATDRAELIRGGFFELVQRLQLPRVVIE